MPEVKPRQISMPEFVKVWVECDTLAEVCQKLDRDRGYVKTRRYSINNALKKKGYNPLGKKSDMGSARSSNMFAEMDRAGLITKATGQG
jgi:hypothetical protein